MDEVDQQAPSTDPMLACCLCRRLLHDAVQLTCLHNCCRQCFSTAALGGNSHAVTCGLCDTVTQTGKQQPNGFIDSQVERYKSITESKVCGKCQQNGEHDKPAVVWCITCRHSLCDGCVPLHSQYFKQHVTQSLDDLSRLDEQLSQKSLSACPIHHLPLDIACCNCEQTKCINCWAECNKEKHKMHVVNKDSFDSYIGELVACIYNMERELTQKSEVLEKPKSVLLVTKSACDCHLEDLKMRKQRILDAVEMVYQEIGIATKNAYDILYAECDAAAEAANRIGSDLSDARTYIHRLVESNDKCEILKQQKIVRDRLSVLSTQLDTLGDRLTTSMGEVKLDVSPSDDLEKMIRAWVGMPRVCSGSSSHPTQRQQPEQQREQSVSFGVTSASVQLPVECKDVTLTADGRSLLLAAEKCGLLEFCSASGRELSYWLPPEKPGHYQSSNSKVQIVHDRYDTVSAVAALSTGRVAVSLYYAHLIVLLRQREQSRSTGDGLPVAPGSIWTEDRRISLPWSCGRLSGNGDELAAWQSGDNKLLLISSSSGQRLNTEFFYKVSINSVAVASRVLVTAHRDSLDARSLPYGQQLWSHELGGSDDRNQLPSDCSGTFGMFGSGLIGGSSNDKNLLLSVCSDHSGSYLYAAVCQGDGSSGRVLVLSLGDGSELQRLALSFDSAASSKLLLRPVQLSLIEGSAVAAEQHNPSSASPSSRVLLLAALCSEPTVGQCRTVVVHRGTCGMS